MRRGDAGRGRVSNGWWPGSVCKCLLRLVKRTTEAQSSQSSGTQRARWQAQACSATRRAGGGLGAKGAPFLNSARSATNPSVSLLCELCDSVVRSPDTTPRPATPAPSRRPPSSAPPSHPPHPALAPNPHRRHAAQRHPGSAPPPRAPAHRRQERALTAARWRPGPDDRGLPFAAWRRRPDVRSARSAARRRQHDAPHPASAAPSAAIHAP